MSDPQAIFMRVLTWSAVLIGILIVAAIVLVAVKRRQQSGARLGADAPPFSLHDLRKLHAEGKLSDEEYAKARQAIIGLAGAVRGSVHDAAESDTLDSDADVGEVGEDHNDEQPPDGPDPGPDSRT